MEAKTISQLPPMNGGESRPQVVEVSCQKAISGDDFYRGQQEFKFCVSGSTHWVPGRSYMSADITLTGPEDAWLNPLAGGSLAPSQHLLACLYQSIEIRIGGRVVQRITDNLSQCCSLIERASKSRGWLEGAGESKNFTSSSFFARVQEVTTPNETIPNKATEDQQFRSAKRFRLLWTPCLGLFHGDVDSLPAGDYSIILTPKPKPQALIDVVEQRLQGDAPSTDYVFSVDKAVMRISTIEMGGRLDDNTYALSLTGINCQSQKIQTTSLSSLNFTVSPSTQALAVGYQDTRASTGIGNVTRFTLAGSNVQCNPFDASENGAGRLTRLYVQYNGVSRPQPDASPEYDPATSTSRLTERYVETYAELGRQDQDVETELDWIRNGPYYYFRWSKDSAANSTHVQVNQSFSNPAGSQVAAGFCNCLLFSMSTSSAQIRVRDGRVIDVLLVE